jgi:arginine-tRNA-protein transferase
VGVLDLLPGVASSVYFFYDPKFKSLNIGIIGSLYEIFWMRNLAHHRYPDFKYYYFGFYIQNSQKMVYKGDFGPAELLDPFTYKFVHFTQEVIFFIGKKLGQGKN